MGYDVLPFGTVESCQDEWRKWHFLIARNYISNCSDAHKFPSQIGV